jgi:hypothetical protein
MKIAFAIATATLALAFSAPANAAVVIYTANGSGVDGAESAKAVITTGVNSLSIDLFSLIANPTSAGQEVSGIILTLANAASSAVLTSSTGTLIDIAGGGAVTPNGGTITHWGLTTSGSSINLATAGGPVGGSPFDLIIGAGPYTNANPSITGRNPQIQNDGLFLLTLTGELNPIITGVTFEFGTGPDSTLPGVLTSVPEPYTWAMMLFGMGSLGAMLRYRNRRRPAATLALA